MSKAKKKPVTSEPTPLFADPDEVQAFARDLSDQFLECRTLQHNWKPFTARWNGEQRAYDVVHRCYRCYSKRLQVVDSRGFVVKSHYEHAEGYLHVGAGRIVGEGRAVLRLESVTRILQMTETRSQARKRKQHLSSVSNTRSA